MLVDTVARGGNLLMNVGPTPRGTFDERAIDALEVYADWMALHSEAIYGCTQSEFEEPQDCRLTQKGNKLYVHIFAWPFKHLHLKGLGTRSPSPVSFTTAVRSPCASGTGPRVACRPGQTPWCSSCRSSRPTS